jgi:hypothetical protein
MSFYVYRAIERVFLAGDEKSWTRDFFEAAGFGSRALPSRETARRPAYYAGENVQHTGGTGDAC